MNQIETKDQVMMKKRMITIVINQEDFYFSQIQRNQSQIQNLRTKESLIKLNVFYIKYFVIFYKFNTLIILKCSQNLILENLKIQNCQVLIKLLIMSNH
ncbi:transmembrane protein, putative (macronuclear) [Tetrahymena thermophila SB210]|uniref:Transmembrane protein, putative n=1 Tax=Tetrahymena thermophila (strain SB210) TaxID=312017 RepID=W7WZ71_TETTS|nr:transmembrane protein, putative [Tetrahymena thermophila SB210]EWS70907.1 transmembrane protein, putative [Tetrahymena thermophila SB210]|eukprot:XP_012656558.1 transmembrane protein, putative [Tetrahymena thermophila SB210]